MAGHRSPFDLADDGAYRSWREHKLAEYPRSVGELVVEVRDPRALSPAEHAELYRLLRRTNMAIYAGRTDHDPDKAIVRRLGEQLGLRALDHNMGADEDAITSLRVASDTLHQGYIPYTDRPIAWHTDGYYNTPGQQIRGLILHCVQPADIGGANRFCDPEIVYIGLRDQDPEHVRALMEPDAMTIPANIVDGVELRPARSGPVFSVQHDGRLHMRYTARRRNCLWKDSPGIQRAEQALRRILETGKSLQHEARLEAGQGLISNNCLHTRSAFESHAHQRLLYRARYYDRLAGT